MPATLEQYRWGEVRLDHPDVLEVVDQALGEGHERTAQDLGLIAIGAADTATGQLEALTLSRLGRDDDGCYAEIIAARTASPGARNLAGPLLGVTERVLAQEGAEFVLIEPETTPQTDRLTEYGYHILAQDVLGEGGLMVKALEPATYGVGDAQSSDIQA